jgi:hypothetical protein
MPNRTDIHIPSLLEDPPRLIGHITQALVAAAQGWTHTGVAPADLSALSAVLLLLGYVVADDGAGRREVCLVLNKRSAMVRQAGDLCCPGGSLSARLDGFVSRLLVLPFSPLRRWPCWRRWRRQRPIEARWLRLCLATGLREAFEEMRLNPLRLRFLGPLPQHRLVLFRRVIYPLVVWVEGQRRFHPNWEVQTIVTIPLRLLLSADHYICYRLSPAPRLEAARSDGTSDHPGFRFRTPEGTELLWGATYQIIMSFLEAVFDFRPPREDRLPVVNGSLSERYLSGR